MATGRELLAAIYSASASTIGTLIELAPTQPGTTLRTTCSLLCDTRYLDLAVDRFDAALWLEYADANEQTTPPDEEDRTERFEAFWGYTRQEVETQISTGDHPDI
jgi:hypothetical protein